MRASIRRLARCYRLLWVDERVRTLEHRLHALEHSASIELAALHAQVAHLLSCAEMAPGLAEEYQEWKRENPIPAEPLVSVCVATYNRARLLTERCLPSILAQSYPHFEVIVVGDGCTDETAQAVARMQDRRLRFVNLPERGRYPEDPMLRWMVAGTVPMNHAMSLARGHYVTHLDDDDEYTPDRLERLVAFAAQTECDFAWHPFWKSDGSETWIVHEARQFARGQVTTSSVFYRSWFTRIGWNIDAYRLQEPGDWNRFRRIQHLRPILERYPEPLLRHYPEGSQRQ